MIFFILLVITFSMDIINFNISKNHKDKKVYIPIMLVIAIMGIFYVKYNDNIQIAPRVLELINFYGGN